MTEIEYPVQGLLSVIYSQYWPANLSSTIRVESYGRSKIDNGIRVANGRRPQSGSRPPNGVRANGWVKTYDGSSREPSYDGSSREVIPGAGLDKNTMKWKGWTSPTRPLEEDVVPAHDHSMYKLTKAEYRRLTDQVRDVGNNLKHGRSRGSTNFRRFVGNRERPDDSTPVLYRSQLAESMKAFEQKNNRRPLAPEPTPEYTRCRPVMGTRPVSVQSERRPISAMEGQRQRPKSSIPASRDTVTSPNVAAQYDTLASPCLYDLTDSDKIDSGYGDVYSINDDEDSSVSDGGDSDASEEGPEPGINDKRNIPVLALRPDVVDFSYATDGKRDYRKYDFDATDVTIDPYEFPYGGPDGFQSVDFKDLSKFDKDWRLMIKKRPHVKEEECLIDRFLELERLATKTAEWEDKRRERCRTANRRRQAESVAAKKEGRLRVQSAKYRGAKCCSECLNQACTGDCPMKKTSAQYCVHCRQEFCNGRCVHSTYNNHSRHSPSSESDDEEKAKPKPRPRSCVPCQRKNTAKYINAHQILLGRPRSSHATYSQGRKTAVLKDDVKIDDPLHVHTDLVRELDRIGLDVDHVSRPNTAKGRKKFRGRPSVVPGKSYFSQRRDSIQKERVKSAPARIRRVKSAQKRLTTAS
ncbi:uncharacterized protein LOC135496063 isoform X2 [Lineus longissimus]|uniref:uncharacterized protein LOC135496063 isoform X2 n=1 Tax=Lineus longissimus TaxID=88925 RepID=UPI002B4D08E3